MDSCNGKWPIKKHGFDGNEWILGWEKWSGGGGVSLEENSKD